MTAEWGKAASEATAASISSYAWFQDAENGALLKKGWFRVVPQKYVDSAANDDDEAHWFYAVGGGEIAKSVVKTIGGKKYAFNEKGEMMSGLVALLLDGTTIEKYYVIETEDEMSDLSAVGGIVYNDPEEKVAIYFFGDEETDGSMKTGTVKTEIDGDEYTLLFNTKGTDKYLAVNGLKNNSWYINGSKVCADEDLKVEAFYATFEDDVAEPTSDNKVNGIYDEEQTGDKAGKCLITSSGSIIKNAKNKKDADEKKYTVVNYVVQE